MIKNCEYCGREYKPPCWGKQAKKQKYCSKECFGKVNAPNIKSQIAGGKQLGFRKGHKMYSKPTRESINKIRMKLIGSRNYKFKPGLKKWKYCIVCGREVHGRLQVIGDKMYPVCIRDRDKAEMVIWQGRR
jgi:hypothetical protein